MTHFALRGGGPFVYECLLILSGETLWNGKWKHPPAIGADIIKQHGAARFTSRGLHELNAAGPRARSNGPIGVAERAILLANRWLSSYCGCHGNPLFNRQPPHITASRASVVIGDSGNQTRGERFPQNKSHHCVRACVRKKDITRLTPTRSRDEAHRKADRSKIRQGQLRM